MSSLSRKKLSRGAGEQPLLYFRRHCAGRPPTERLYRIFAAQASSRARGPLPATVSAEESYTVHTDLDGNFLRELEEIVPDSRLISDPLRTLAYGTDASLYQLVPKLVVRVNDEPEMSRILALAKRHRVPVTFRAAGTSLSGQAITDSVLLLIGDSWRRSYITLGAARISLQPAVVGGHANRLLAPFGKKIGPDPASLSACHIGGIAANNASGMCCGNAFVDFEDPIDILRRRCWWIREPVMAHGSLNRLRSFAPNCLPSRRWSRCSSRWIGRNAIAFGLSAPDCFRRWVPCANPVPR